MKSKSSTSRKRSRRPKFLSLRRQITAEADQKIQSATAEMTPPPDETNVADRFFTGEEGCATTLTGLLQPEKEEAADSPMSSVSAAYSVDGRSLVRAAMRSREREDGEEEEVRWVRMSQVVSEEVSSRAVEEEEEEGEETRWLGRRRDGAAGGGGGLALKLDYKEVEEAWDGCGKGRPFFSWPDSSSTVEGPQIVPDLRIHDDFFYHHDLNAANGVLWGVPDQKSCIQHGVEENGDQSIEGWRLGQREASVLRYREKRMNRLFSKRIRYQVRKLNAEKRPRVKGRFVKRS